MKMKLNMKGGRTLNEFLSNKTVLLVVAVFAVLNLIGYLMYGMNHLVIIYIILAALFYHFSQKNMTTTLGAPLVIVTVLVLLHRKYGIMTGLEGMENATAPISDASMNQLKQTVQQKVQQAKTNAATKRDIHMTEMDNTAESTAAEPEPATEESFEGNSKKGRYRVDYASTIEDAYDELNHVLGSDGIKNLTQDTHSLMKKQLELAESMKSMGPLIQSMAPLLKQAQGLLSMAPPMTVSPPQK